ncbi:hypothetical protein PG996_013174 [Apiospora saccharicola]|uniref:Polyketide synthase n=1 Tax=Apiospora saccharicola TaxID=335842 RepID=A0ABR1U4V3_9PEZI
MVDKIGTGDERRMGLEVARPSSLWHSAAVSSRVSLKKRFVLVGENEIPHDGMMLSLCESDLGCNANIRKSGFHGFGLAGCLDKL